MDIVLFHLYANLTGFPLVVTGYRFHCLKNRDQSSALFLSFRQGRCVKGLNIGFGLDIHSVLC